MKEAIPRTLEAQALYSVCAADAWKKYYNTYLGAGTAQKYIESYTKYVL